MHIFLFFDIINAKIMNYEGNYELQVMNYELRVANESIN